MNLPAEIQEIFELAGQTDAVIESRYLRTGPKQRIETRALLAAVEAVRAKGRSATRRQDSYSPPRKFCLDEGPITLASRLRTPQDAPDCHPRRVHVALAEPILRIGAAGSPVVEKGL
jgi:hypothetical protein